MLILLYAYQSLKWSQVEKDKEWEGSGVVWGIVACDMKMDLGLKALYQGQRGLFGT